MDALINLRLHEVIPYLGIPLALHIIGITVAVDAVLHGRSSQATIAWLLGLAFMPYISLPLYLAIGWRRLEGYTDARREGDAAIHHLGERLRKTLEDVAWVDYEHDEPERTLARLARMPLLRGNHTRLLIDGDATYESMLAGIAAAQHTVMVQSYCLRHDATGERFAEAMLERAAAGCRVLLLVDRVGSHALSGSYCRRLTKGGVEIAWFTTGRGWLFHRFRINFRNHRKIIIVDGEQAWIGGCNIGDEYLSQGKSRSLRPWRDTHLSFRGPAALAAQLVFVEDWHWATGTVPDLSWEPKPHPDDQPMLILPTGPADAQETAQLTILQAVLAAQERVWIATPYFVPDDAILAALSLAVTRGVDVRIMVPGVADHYLVYWAGQSFLAQVAKMGVRVGIYRPGFTHQKVWLVDDHVASIGSLNWDNRAIHLNFEISAILLGKEQVAEVADMYRGDWRYCHECTTEYYAKRLWPQRFFHRLARLAAPLL